MCSVPSFPFFSSFFFATEDSRAHTRCTCDPCSILSLFLFLINRVSYAPSQWTSTTVEKPLRMFTGDGTTEVCVTLDYKERKFGKSCVSFTWAMHTLPLGSISTAPGMRKEKRKKKGISQFHGIAGRLEAPPFFFYFFSFRRRRATPPCTIFAQVYACHEIFPLLQLKRQKRHWNLLSTLFLSSPLWLFLLHTQFNIF